MRSWVLFFGFCFFLSACHKQVGGPRKITAVGHIEYSFSTGIITKVLYEKKSTNVFSIRINKNHTISGDAVGTWAESGAQISIVIDGDFGPNSPFQVDHGYYRNEDHIAIEGHEINMREFAKKTYFVAVSQGYIGANQYYRQFVFE